MVTWFLGFDATIAGIPSRLVSQSACKLFDHLAKTSGAGFARKMKWRNYVYSRKSEDTFLNDIETTFGKDCVLAYGDWSRTTQMKNYMPTKNIGIRRIIHKRFQTISVGEYNSSKKCCDCYGDLEYVNKSKTVRHLKCPKCLSSENKKQYLEHVMLIQQ